MGAKWWVGIKVKLALDVILYCDAELELTVNRVGVGNYCTYCTVCVGAESTAAPDPLKI